MWDLGVLKPDLLPGETEYSRWSIILEEYSAVLDAGCGDNPMVNSWSDLSSYDLCLSIFRGLGLSNNFEKSHSSIPRQKVSALILPFWERSTSVVDISKDLKCELLEALRWVYRGLRLISIKLVQSIQRWPINGNRHLEELSTFKWLY